MEVSVNEAARHLDVSADTIRRRIRKGALNARQVPRGQGFAWSVTVDDETTFPGQDNADLVTALQERIEAQERLLEAREREVRELHQLLAAGALEAGKRRPWWKVWG